MPGSFTKRTFELQTNGDSALDIRFADAPGPDLSETIIALAQAIESASIPGVTELIPAYQCLTVCFDLLQLPDDGAGTQRLVDILNELVRVQLTQPSPVAGPRYQIKIPVCYAPEFAPDMQALSNHVGLPADQVIRRHSATDYLVHMLGFTPGFLYLGGLDRQLHCPRKDRPTLNVPAGSVGIGGGQTGIYPQQTPGGWQIIGRTPLALFRPQRDPAFIARPLDRIRFVAISAQQFAETDPFAEPEKIPIDTAETDLANAGNIQKSRGARR
ncbi:5-oxoprolinase subunit PxpB [Microbulbifer sp.]|uniref:5-oxoprolinase subunit PxpB n=1 Tax=Microbulbifer sp. TaxID=1908541 RepID=UPI00258CF6B3|nr:5-oxoprolinase subunit PxpB [Microbulbifer sp.]